MDYTHECSTLNVFLPCNSRCKQTFTVAPGTVLVVECSAFRTADNKRRGCRKDYVEMTLGGSQSMRFCGRDLDRGSLMVEPQTFAYPVEWEFISNRRGRLVG